MAYGMSDLWMFVLSYSIIIFVTFFLMNFLTKGFIIKYIRVKASRGAKSLVRVHCVTHTKYRIGWVEQGVLCYKESKNVKRYHKANKYNVMREMGVNVFEVEEDSSNVRTVNWQATPGHNTDHFDNILTRALEKPSLADKTKDTIMLLLQIAQTIGIGVLLVLVYNLMRLVTQLSGGSGGVI